MAAYAMMHKHPTLGVDIGFSSIIQGLFYADDVVLLATSIHDLQCITRYFERCITHLGLTINTKVGKSAVLSFNARAHKSIKTLHGTIHPQPYYRYLGIIFTPNLSWKQAYELRREYASTKLHAVIAASKVQQLDNPHLASIVFNAEVMSTLLYGVEIWGWKKLLIWHALHNTFQQMHGSLIRSIMHLPSASDVVLLLESGTWPVMMYAMKRAMLYMSRIIDSSSALLKHIYYMPLSTSTRHHYNALLALLGNPSMDYSFDDTGCTEILNTFFTDVIKHAYAHPDDPLCKTRKRSFFIHYVWNGILHKVPPFYNLQLPFPVIRAGIKARLAFTPFLADDDHTLPFTHRTCPFCSHAPCDGPHIYLQCPKFSVPRLCYLRQHNIPSSSLRELFQTNNPIIYYYFHHIFKMYMEELTQLQRDDHEDANYSGHIVE